MESGPSFELRALPHRQTLLTTATSTHYVIEAPVHIILDHWRQWSDQPDVVDSIPTSLLALFQAAHQHLRDVNPAYADEYKHQANRVRQGDFLPTTRFLISADEEVASEWSRLAQGRWPEAESVTGSDIDILAMAMDEGSTVLRIIAGSEDLALSHFWQLARNTYIKWIPITVERDTIWVGPVQGPNEPTWEDLQRRRIAVGRSEAMARALRSPSLNGNLILCSQRMINEAFMVIENIQPGFVYEIKNNETPVKHAVMAWPDTGSDRPIRYTAVDMVSKECGIITRLRSIRHSEELPTGLYTVQADMSSTQRVSPWNCAYICGGSSFEDPSRAEQAALGEAAERYAGNCLDTRPVTYATYRELRAAGRRAVSPDSVILYHEKDYADPTFSFEPFRQDLRLGWVDGQEAGTGETVAVPGALVYSSWAGFPHTAEPPIIKCPYAGIAAGQTIEQAINNAIEEIIERHATMIWWLNNQPLPRFVNNPELLSRLGSLPAHQEISFIGLDNEFEIPVVCAVVRNRKYQTINLGFAARPTYRAAAIKALTEAFILQEGSIDLLDAEGSHWRAIRSGRLSRAGLKPFRADRRYRLDFKPDFTDCTELMAQQQYYLDPDAAGSLEDLLGTEQIRIWDEATPRVNRCAQDYIELMKAHGYHPIIVDITPSDIAQTGLCVVRVVVPGMVTNSPAAYPPLGSDVVTRAAVTLGWRSEPLTRSEINRRPIPHA